MAGPQAPSQRALARELVPYLAVLAGVAAVGFTYPGMTHWLRSAPTPGGESPDELLRAMSQPRERVIDSR